LLPIQLAPIRSFVVAKAQVTTPSGVSIKVEGTPAEILAIVQDLEKGQAKGGTKAASKTRTPRVGKTRSTLTDLISSLADGGFFKTPRDLGTIKAALAQAGHHYPVSTLSGTVLTKVRNRELRRLKEKGRWLYTKGPGG
jgi:hypothetical protein